MVAFGGFETLRAVFDKQYVFSATAPDWHGRVWAQLRGLEPTSFLPEITKACLDQPDLTVVVVVPPKPTTRWWLEYATLAKEIFFLTGEIDTLACAVLVFSSDSITRMLRTRRPETYYWDWRRKDVRG